MRPWRRFGLVLAATGLTTGAPARAADEAVASGRPSERLSDADLAEQRGGFAWGGLDIRFGAEVSGYLGSELVMRTSVSWTGAAGTDVQNASLAPAAAAGLRAMMLAAGGLDGRLDKDSVMVANEGRTVFVQRTDGSIRNVILNSASNVDLRQQIDARLDIGGFTPFRADILAARVGTSLAALRSLGGI